MVTHIGNFELSVSIEEEKDCIHFSETGKNTWSEACLYSNDTFIRENMLEDGSYLAKSWDLNEVDHAKNCEEGLDCLSKAEKDMLMTMANKYG